MLVSSFTYQSRLNRFMLFQQFLDPFIFLVNQFYSIRQFFAHVILFLQPVEDVTDHLMRKIYKPLVVPFRNPLPKLDRTNQVFFVYHSIHLL